MFGTRSPFSHSCVDVTELLTGLLPPTFCLYPKTRSIVTGHRDWAFRASHPHLGTAQGARGPVRARERHGRSRAYHGVGYATNFTPRNPPGTGGPPIFVYRATQAALPWSPALCGVTVSRERGARGSCCDAKKKSYWCGAAPGETAGLVQNLHTHTRKTQFKIFILTPGRHTRRITVHRNRVRRARRAPPHTDLYVW